MYRFCMQKQVQTMESNFKKHWYSINSRTTWHRLPLPYSSLQSTTKCHRNNSMGSHKMPLKSAKKRVDCLGTSRLSSNTTELPEFSFYYLYILQCMPERPGTCPTPETHSNVGQTPTATPAESAARSTVAVVSPGFLPDTCGSMGSNWLQQQCYQKIARNQSPEPHTWKSRGPNPLQCQQGHHTILGTIVGMDY